MKRFLACLLVLALLCTGLTGCSRKQEEESAAADTVVESEKGDAPVQEDAPEIVDNPEGFGGEDTPAPDETPDPGNEPEDEGNEPEENPDDEQQPAEQPDNGDDEQVSNDAPDYNIKTMTFNVRYTDDSNGHSIAERAPRVKATIESHDPDLIGMQEVVPAWDELLRETMTDYEVLTHYRSATNKEGVSILYKKDGFTFIDEGFFWCSETPEKESHGWGSQFPRVCSWVLLKQKTTGKEILFFSFHGEWNDAFAEGSCDLILKEAAKHPDAATFLVGDFNLSSSSKGYIYFSSHFDEARTILSNPTSDVFMGTRPGGYPDPTAPDETLSSLDYLFHQEDKAEAVDYIVDTTRYDGYYASDHYALVGLYNVL